MSMEYCQWCDRHIDTDEDLNHFDEGGNCVEFIGYQLTNQES